MGDLNAMKRLLKCCLIFGVAGALFLFLLGVLNIQPMILQDEFHYFDEARKFPIADSTLPNILFLYFIKLGLMFELNSLTSVRILNFAIFSILWVWLLARDVDHIDPVLRWLFPICCPILILLSYSMPDLLFSASIIIALLLFVEFRSFLLLGLLLAILCLIKPHGYYISALAWTSAGIALIFTFQKKRDTKQFIPVFFGGLVQVLTLCIVKFAYFGSFDPFIFGSYSRVTAGFLSEQYYLQGLMFLGTILGFKLALAFSYYSCFGWVEHYGRLWKDRADTNIRFSDLFLSILLILMPVGMLCISSIFTVMTDVQASSEKAFVFLRYSAAAFLLPYFVNVPSILSSNPNIRPYRDFDGPTKLTLGIIAIAAFVLISLSGFVNYAWNDQMALIEQSDVLNYALVLLVCCAACWHWRRAKRTLIIPILFVGLTQATNLVGYVKYFSSIPNVPLAVANYLSTAACKSVTVYDDWSPNAQKIFYYMDPMPYIWREGTPTAEKAAAADCLVLHADKTNQTAPKWIIIGPYFITHGKFF